MKYYLEAFALVREAAKRNLGERHYDVQLIGDSPCIAAKSPRCELVKEKL